MLVDNNKYKNRYVVDGSATKFAIEFPFLDASHIEVYSQSGIDPEIIVPSSEYTITGAGDESGGKLIFNTPPTAGTVIAIIRNVPITQLYAYTELDNFPAESHENALAKLTMICQQLKESGDRAIKASVTSNVSGEDIMAAIEQNAIIVEQTKEECLAALDEIHDANYAPQGQVDTLAENLQAVSDTAGSANDTAQANAESIQDINDTLSSLNQAVEQAASIANQALETATAAISYRGTVPAVADLPNDAASGDIYVVEADTKAYIFDGENWSEFSVINIDETITAGSSNPVAGGAIKTALDTKAADSSVLHKTGDEDLAGVKTWIGTNIGPKVQASDNSQALAMMISNYGNAGLYDNTKANWLVRRHTATGDFYLGAKLNSTETLLRGTAAGALTWGGNDITGDVKKITQPANVKDYGAVGDGVTNDTQAIKNAIATGRNVYIPKGVYVITDELTLVTQGQHIYGDGRGFGRGHASSPVVKSVFDWVDNTTLLFKNTGPKYKRTLYKINYNSSTSTRWYNDSDANKGGKSFPAYSSADPAMSAGINVQAEGVMISDLCVRLWVDPTYKNWPGSTYTDTIIEDAKGANWDIGIFVGTRLEFTLLRVACVGFFRKANIWVDVSWGVSYTKYRDYSSGSATFPTSLAQSGGDGTLFEDVFTSGGLWGVRIQGGEPRSSSDADMGKSDLGTRPYLRLRNAAGEWRAYTDMRGSYGFSDFTMINCEITGGMHSSRKRFVDFPYASTTAAKTALNTNRDVLELGGAYMISGIAANTSRVLQGHRYISTRFESAACFVVLINHSRRDTFIGCHGERGTFLKVNAAGTAYSTIDTSVNNSFGVLCVTANHTALRSIATQMVRWDTYYDYKHSDMAIGQESATGAQIAGSALRLSLEDSAGNGQSTMFEYSGTDTFNMRPDTAAHKYQAEFYSYLLKNAHNGTNIFNLAHNGTLELHNTLFSNNASANLGKSGNPWNNIYANSGSIQSSDERLKDNIADLDDSLMRAWSKIRFKVFQFKEAITTKGQKARLHVGLIAQQVIEAFATEGLDARKYGLLCYDEWPDEFEDYEVIDVEPIRDAEGETIVPGQTHIEHRLIRAAGNTYGIRYEEALALECAYQRWQLEQFRRKLEQLEVSIATFNNEV